jgi:hypothetical protein
VSIVVVTTVAGILSPQKAAPLNPSPQQKPIVPPSTVNVPTVSPKDSAYHGFDSIAFGKGWVRLKSGRTIFAIDHVAAAPNGQVAITRNDGTASDFSAKDLPQGFLDEWGITPEKLKMEDRQVP